MLRFWIGLLVAATAAACGGEGKRSLADQGRRDYAANCTACHHPDPRRDGALGPAVAGSSRALLEARVLRAEYPPGYQPKRQTRQMMALPHLAPQLEALAVYLADVLED